MRDKGAPETRTRRPKVTSADFKRTAEHIYGIYRERCSRRRDLEKQWDEIDRQKCMEPYYTNREGGKRDGRCPKETEWMPFLELPWQAQTHELLTSDMRRLAFPTDRDWFSATPDDSDEVLQNIASGLEGQGVPVGSVNQETVQAIVEAAHFHFQALYDFRGEWDKLHGDAVSYGAYAARVRQAETQQFAETYRGVKRTGKKWPRLIHTPIRNAYLDDAPASVFSSGHVVAPSDIFVYHIHVDDLRKSVATGSTDPDSVDGGWIRKSVAGIDSGRSDKNVMVLEYEGDLIIPRSGESLFLPNVIVNAVIGVDENNTNKTALTIYRWRFKKLPFHTYIKHPYHVDGDYVYGTSPLMKGRPIQRVASDQLSRLLQMGILKLQPPLQYDPDEAFFAASGGPQLRPNAKWAVVSTVQGFDVGDPSLMSGALQVMKAEYEAVTGTTAPRLGQQTKSHTTAYAVDTELSRGVIRTVDYIRAEQKGPMQTFLNLEYEMIRDLMGQLSVRMFVPKYRQYIDVTRDMLPETVTYDVTGAAEPLERREQMQNKIAAMQFVLSTAPVAAQIGQPVPNISEINRQVLNDAGIDGERIINSPTSDGVSSSVASGPNVSGIDSDVAAPQNFALAS